MIAPRRIIATPQPVHQLTNKYPYNNVTVCVYVCVSIVHVCVKIQEDGECENTLEVFYYHFYMA